MSLPQPITLFTSIPPRTTRFVHSRELGARYQRFCLRKWQDAGFDVVTVNAAGEIAALQERWPEIKVIEAGTARPKIADLCRAIKAKTTSAFVGVVNADVVYTGGRLGRDALLGQIEDGMIVSERSNISRDLKRTGRSCYGFDAFFFHRRLLDRMTVPASMTIGETWWDYIFCLEALKVGTIVKRAEPPILWHLDHPTAWDDAQFYRNGRQVFLRYAAMLGLEQIDEQDATDIVIGMFARLVFRWLLRLTPTTRLDGKPIVQSAVSSVSGPRSFASREEDHYRQWCAIVERRSRFGTKRVGEALSTLGGFAAQVAVKLTEAGTSMQNNVHARDDPTLAWQPGSAEIIRAMLTLEERLEL